MPISALIEGEVFCLHGGLSPSITSLQQIRELNRVTDVNVISFSDVLNSLLNNTKVVSVIYSGLIQTITVGGGRLLGVRDIHLVQISVNVLIERIILVLSQEVIRSQWM